MERKGFPESYDVAALLAFLSDIKAGEPRVTAPVYSHLTYDIVPGETITIDQPDILILEGLNVLQPRDLPRDGKRDPLRLRFLRFLDLYRRRRGGGARLVHRALHAPAARRASATHAPISANMPI